MDLPDAYAYDAAKVIELAKDRAMDEGRLVLLNKAVEKEKSSLSELLKRSSQLEETKEHDKIHLTDAIEAMEEVEVATHSTALRLSAYSVERSRLVRIIMRKNANIRKLAAELSEEEDPAEENDVEQEVRAKVDVCMGKKSGLEEHIEKEGKNEVAFALQPGTKAKLDEKTLASNRAKLDSVVYFYF